jgi:signal transduction histidine kinase
MLLEGYAGDMTQRQKNFLNTAYESNERQLKIIDDLLNVAQLDADKVSLNFSKVDLVKFMKSIIAEQSKAIKKRRQTIKLNRSKPRILCNMDEARMRMVLENILDNASKYSYEDKEIVVTIAQTPQKTSISIADKGVGITKEDIGQLFQKFIRIDNPLSSRVGGTGIGLYWAKRIIDLHKGSIEIKSKIGKGTTFTIIMSPSKETDLPVS